MPKVNKTFKNARKSLNLFPDYRKEKNICMRYICITKYTYHLTINKANFYKNSKFLYSKTDDWPSVKIIVKILYASTFSFLCYEEMSKIWKKLIKLVSIEEENLHIYWTTWGISMKLSGNMWLMILPKVTEN